MRMLALLLTVDTTTTLTVRLGPAQSVAVTPAGPGTPIVLVPGLFGSAYTFRGFAPRLVVAGDREEPGAVDAVAAFSPIRPGATP